ncbi:MAG: S41 family peptidase [Candidatus Eisenbacteria bacterium]|nr:S41 family peptidase [Candidatus Eisenbacteria bacterium]
MIRVKKTTVATLALAIGAGTLIGVLLTGDRVQAQTEKGLYSQLNLFSRVLDLIEKNYVEEIDPEPLIEGAITGMLAKLDPHSTYVDSERFAKMNERNQGEYHGIGVSFEIRDGYITVISPIEGSPSDALGIRGGDRIVKIDDVSAKGISSEEVFDKLRGPKGSKVHVTIQRPGIDDLFEYDIIRDKIPIYSVPYHFMLDETTGYVRAIRFSATTAQELGEAIQDLLGKGMQRLVFDLRGNAGGYLNQAIEVSDMFLPGGKTVVYTKGRIPDSSQYYYSTDNDKMPNFPVIVLVDHGSASASEIVAGAIQDHDRGLILGVTTFGKGLVQRQYTLKDGSALLLTVARYYTPSGRLIQRDYSDRENYVSEEAIEEAEAETEKAAGGTEGLPQFKTDSGRTVFGGGGVTPDVRTEYTRKLTELQTRLEREQLFSEFAPRLANSRGMTKNDDFEQFIKTWQIDEATLGQFKGFVDEKSKSFPEDRKITYTVDEWKTDLIYARQALKREVARTVWGDMSRYQVAISDDEMIAEAMRHFDQAALMARNMEGAAVEQR